jgi:hypothetical protein
MNYYVSFGDHSNPNRNTIPSHAETTLVHAMPNAKEVLLRMSILPGNPE